MVAASEVRKDSAETEEAKGVSGPEAGRYQTPNNVPLAVLKAGVRRSI